MVPLGRFDLTHLYTGIRMKGNQPSVSGDVSGGNATWDRVGEHSRTDLRCLPETHNDDVLMERESVKGNTAETVCN